MSVDVSVSGAVAVVTLNRPDVLNALDDDHGRALLSGVSDVAADPAVRSVVITGAGRAFCSGEDLGALASGYERGEAPPLGDTLIRRYNPLIRTIRGAPKPVVAALNGVAAGAGASIALACDFRIASEHARLALGFVKVGLVPDSGALWLLAEIVGAARAFEICALGDPLAAEACLRLGLVTEVVDAGAFEERWGAFAAALAAGPTRAYALTKELAHRASDRSLDDELDAEVDAQTKAGATRDHLEGVRAFLAKRPPDFQGS